jgi:methionine biosynthesis protein MetW
VSLREHYEGLASREIGGFVTNRVRKAAGLFQKHLPARRRLLDVGCGVGGVAAYLKTALAIEEICGVDIGQQAVRAAVQRGVAAVQCDLDSESLPFEGGYFDAIFAGEVIEHLVNPDHFLQEIRRTLTADGVVVITTPNLASWLNRIVLLCGWQPFETGTSLYHEVGRPRFLRLGDGGGMAGHLRLYTQKALKELLQAHGFEILETTACPAKEGERRAWPWAYAPWFLLDQALTMRPSLGHRMVIAARPKG